MSILSILVIAVVVEARRYENDDAVAKGIDVFERHFKSPGPMGTPRLGYPQTGPQRPISFRDKAKAPYNEASIDSYHQFEPLLYVKPVFTNAREEALFLMKHPEFNEDEERKPRPLMKPRNVTRISVKKTQNKSKVNQTLSRITPAENTSKVEWTTCDEFKDKAFFHPKSVLNKQWEPFYVWSQRYFPTSRLHTFEIPNSTVVQRYRRGISKYFRKKIDWNAPMLLMKVTREHLLVAVDLKGSFISLPRLEKFKHKKVVLKTKIVRLKMVDSYVAMMFCIKIPYYATIMAMTQNVPASIKDKRREAAKLKFKGRGYVVSKGNVTHQSPAKPREDVKN